MQVPCFQFVHYIWVLQRQVEHLAVELPAVSQMEPESGELPIASF